MKNRTSLLAIALLLTACGGGGGGSNQIVPNPGGGGGGAPVGGGGGMPVGGGGGGLPGGFFDFDTGLGGSGGLIGSIGAFGSIIVNGVEMETDSASFFIEGSSGTQSDLREGHRVIVVGNISNLDADEVHYRSNIKGPVSAVPVIGDLSVARATLIVLGQTVRTNAETIFHGTDLSILAEGHLLEVSGATNSDGEILATFVEFKTTLPEYKAIGLVKNLDTGAATFDLGGLLVDYSSTSFSDFEGAVLINDQLVEVKLDAVDFTAPASAAARNVELLPVPVIREGAEVEVEGLIDSFISATEFRVSGVPVTTDGNTQYEGGSSASLGLNVKVEAEGVANSSGVVVADEIEIKQTKAVRVEGTVTSVDLSSQTVSTSLGVAVSVQPFTELEDDSSAAVDPFSLADLVANVDRVEIRGYLSGSTVIAVELAREDADPRALLRGPVSAFDASAGTMQILSTTVSVGNGVTSYEDEDDNPLSRTAFFTLIEIGGIVSARWDNFASIADAVDEISLEDPD